MHINSADNDLGINTPHLTAQSKGPEATAESMDVSNIMEVLMGMKASIDKVMVDVNILLTKGETTDARIRNLESDSTQKNKLLADTVEGLSE